VIGWLTLVEISIAVAAGLLATVLGLLNRRPSDLTLGSAALVEVLLVAQIVVAIVAPLSGNAPSGNPLEFWVYLISAALLPIAGVAWALVERSRWSTVVVGIACLAVAIMLYRMQVIWTIQQA
jgi:hypothetical protein